MVSTLSQGEEAQLMQTIEMFEVITQSQPHDYQSLEILKEAYSKLGREQDFIGTSKRIALAYVQRASSPRRFSNTKRFCSVGRESMHKIFVGGKIITNGDFDLCWAATSVSGPVENVVDPFIQILNDKGILQLDKSLKILSDKSHTAYLPLDKYDVDLEFARKFPAETCRRWCVLPFDRMSKSILVATANPFNQQAAKELAAVMPQRLLWYLASPTELTNNLRKVFR